MFDWPRDWLIVCFYEKVFLPSNLNSVDFWGGRNCFLLDILLPDRNVIRKLGFFYCGECSTMLFSSSNEVQTHKASIWCKKNLHGTVWNSGCLDHKELPNFLQKDIKAECVAEITEKVKFLGTLMHKEVENLDDHACPKVHDFTDSQADGEIWICWSYPFRHKTTLHCSQRMAKLLGQWTMQHLKL